MTIRNSQLIIEESLIQDIRDFIPIFHRVPTIAKVTDWANDFYSFPPSKKCLEKLIILAADTICHCEDCEPKARQDVAIS